MSEEKDRMGTSFERLVADVFSRMGFRVKLNVFTNKENGEKSEQDVLAEKGNLKILVQCKDYAKFPNMKMEETIQDLIEDGDSIGADKLILAILGLKDSNKWKSYAEEKGIYLWNENYWRKLQNLDLYDLILEIGKNLDIEEILRRVSKEEEKNLKSIYENIESIKDPKRRKLIFQELERIDLSSETKKLVNLKKIENEILLEKEKEIEELNNKLREQNKEKTEDIELEEIFRLIGSSPLDYHKRYQILEKIKRELSLSQKSGRILDIERIKTFIEKQTEDSSAESWGDERYIDLEKLIDEGLLSDRDKRKIQEEIGQTIGISKKGYTESQKIKIERIIKWAIFKKKIYKILIAVGVWAMISFILWRILF